VVAVSGAIEEGVTVDVAFVDVVFTHTEPFVFSKGDDIVDDDDATGKAVEVLVVVVVVEEVFLEGVEDGCWLL
jgi:hypothetical protein